MLTPTTAPPNSVTPEAHAELTSRTPASFSDIPPVLRWEDDAEVELASPNWTHWPAAADTANGGVNAGVKGRLYVTEAAVTFLPANLTGWTLTFPALTLHALTPAGERPAHIYCQIDENSTTTGADEEEEYAQLSEMRIFVAADKLESLFTALSNCSALHDSLLPSGEPSSFFGFGDDDDDDEWDGPDGNGAFDDADEGASANGGRAVPGATAQLNNAANEDENDDDEADSEVDAITAFLSKVDWGTVPPPSGWVDVDTDDKDGMRARHELDAARGRVAYLERLLKEERARVAELEAKVAALDGERFADHE